MLNYIVIIIFLVALFVLNRLFFKFKRARRQDYYRNVYLQSDEWNRKRHLVLKRDNWRCFYCGERATQVHHTRYARRRIGKEPIKWLVSVCKPCHDKIHGVKH